MQQIKQLKKSSFYLGLTIFYILVTLLTTQWLIHKGEFALKMEIDAPFHFARLKGLAEFWNGPISFNNFLHYGTPVNIFYPWLTLYPMFIIYQLIHSLVGSYLIYFALLTFATLWLCYYVALKMSKDKKIAILFSLVYTLAEYRQANILYRHAVGEAIAMSAFPIILYGVYKIFYAKQKNFIPLTIGMTLLAYTHIISLAIASAFVLVVLVWNIVQKHIDKEKIKIFFQSTIVSILLSIGSLIPIIYYRLYTTVQDPKIQDLNEQSLKPMELITSTFNNQLGMRQYTIGLAIFISFYFIWKQWKNLGNFEKTMTYIGLISLLLCTSLFPWSYFQDVFTLIQFPWRILGIAVLCLAYTGSYAFCLTIGQNNLKKLIIAIIVILFLQISLVASFMPASETTKQIFTSSRYQHIVATSFSGKTDYMGKRASEHLNRYKKHQVYVANKPLKTKATYQVKVATFEFINSKEQSVDLPLLASPGLQVRINNQLVDWQKNKYDGVSVKAPQGQIKIQVKSTYSKVLIVSYIISFVTLMLFCLHIIKFFHKKKDCS